MADRNIDASRTALLSMDLQIAIVSIYTKNEPDFISRVGHVLEEARKNSLRVMHVQTGFRPAFPKSTRAINSLAPLRIRRNGNSSSRDLQAQFMPKLLHKATRSSSPSTASAPLLEQTWT